MDHHRIYISCQAIKLPVSSHPLPFPIFFLFSFPPIECHSVSVHMYWSARVGILQNQISVFGYRDPLMRKDHVTSSPRAIRTFET